MLSLDRHTVAVRGVCLRGKTCAVREMSLSHLDIQVWYSKKKKKNSNSERWVNFGQTLQLLIHRLQTEPRLNQRHLEDRAKLAVVTRVLWLLLFRTGSGLNILEDYRVCTPSYNIHWLFCPIAISKNEWRSGNGSWKDLTRLTLEIANQVRAGFVVQTVIVGTTTLEWIVQSRIWII